MEHGGIGHAYGRAGYGTDIRLACHGLDKNDNDFVVGLLGPELYPLSSIVQRMRKTKQTSLHLERLGPFFIGKAIWQAGQADGARRCQARERQPFCCWPTAGRTRWMMCRRICWISAAGARRRRHLVDEITHRYGEIGGCSPLLRDHTQRGGAACRRSWDLPVYVGMRHWHPFIKDDRGADGWPTASSRCVVDLHGAALQHAEHRRLLARGWTRRWQRAAEATMACTDFVESWHTQPEYLDAVAANVRATLARVSRRMTRRRAGRLHGAQPARVHPRSAASRTTGNCARRRTLLAERLGLPDGRWMFSYQSAAKTGVPWLGPQIEDLVAELAAQGERNLLIAPIGFIADHVEVLYDIDIGVQAHRPRARRARRAAAHAQRQLRAGCRTWRQSSAHSVLLNRRG